MLAPVEAEKAMFLGMYLSGIPYPSFSLITTDFPVPVAPGCIQSLYKHFIQSLYKQKTGERKHREKVWVGTAAKDVEVVLEEDPDQVRGPHRVHL